MMPNTTNDSKTTAASDAASSESSVLRPLADPAREPFAMTAADGPETGQPAHLRDLRPDPANRRRHNPRNVGVIVDALHHVGAARSIVIDEHGTILCGNATVDAAAEAGITKVQVVDADGETIVAVRRRGLTDEQKRQLALA